MTGIIVVFPNKDNATNIRNLLARGGMDVIGVCSTGAQAMHYADTVDDGIVVCGYRMKDMMYAQLREYLPDSFEMLLIASQDKWSSGDVEGVVGLSTPIKVYDLMNTMNMMLQSMDRKRKKRKKEAKNRDPKQQKTIRRAKELLMERNNMSEGEAHRYLQKSSMDSGTNMVETAEMVLSEMCGNGIRCVAKYVYDYGLTDKTQISVETLGGIKYLDLAVEDGKVSLVKVDMGKPELEADRIPIISEREQVIDEPIEVDGKEYHMTGVSMGNPHTVIYVDDVKGLDLEKIGPKFENHERFPKRINTEFVHCIDRQTVEMRVWERGSGETLACGTGACAVAVSSILNNLTDTQVTVKLLGGDLQIEWDREKDRVFMTGPATVVFDGVIDITEIKE